MTINYHKEILSILKRIKKKISGTGITKSYLGKTMYNSLLSVLKTNYVEVEGHKMFLDLKDSLNLSVSSLMWCHEKGITELLKKEIKEGMTVLDLGSHIGYFTLIVAKLVGEQGKVFAFEPDSANFTLLKKNVEVNGYRNVQCIQKAVSNKTGKTKLYLSKKATRHAIYNLYNTRRSIEVEITSLDAYFKDYNGKIDFVKMDIEGSEPHALQGMSNLMQRNKNIKIVLEFFPTLLRRVGSSPESYLNDIIKYGFKLYNINESKEKVELEPIEKDNLYDFIQMYSGEEYTNMFCVKEK